MEKLKIAQVAKKLGVTTQAVYKKLATVGNVLQPNLVKESGVTYVLPAGVVFLQESFGKSQQEPVATVGNSVDSVVASFEKRLDEQKEIIGGLQRTIDTLISQHSEERTRSDTIIMKLTNDVGNMQKYLEHKTQEKEEKAFEVLQKAPPIVQAWKPETPADPLEGLGFFERIWVQFVEPQKLRQYDS